MNSYTRLFILYLLTFCCSIAYAQKEDLALKHIDANTTAYADAAMQIWNFAELGYQEYKSSALLQKTLKEAGFTITTGVAGMPTAFIAEYGSGKPVIGILGEYDALPGLSQAVVPEEKPIEAGEPGHGCGHHLFGVGSAAAAIAVSEWLTKTKTTGTIRYYGTPAEEGGGGKTYMVKAGMFDDVDAVLTGIPPITTAPTPAHLSPINPPSSGSMALQPMPPVPHGSVGQHSMGSSR